MKIKIVFALLIVGAAINMQACYVIPKFELERPDDKVESFAILTDITVFNSEDGKYIVNLPQSIELSHLAVDTLKNLLESKGYFVSRVYPPAPGHFLTKTGGFYKTYYSVEDYSKSYDSLKLSSPPFNLQEEHVDTFLTAAILKNRDFYKSEHIGKSDSAKPYNCLLVLQAIAVEESIDPEKRKSVLSAMFSGDISGPPYIDASCWIVDTETGKTLYSNRYLLNKHITPDIIKSLMSYYKWVFRK